MSDVSHSGQGLLSHTADPVCFVERQTLFVASHSRHSQLCDTASDVCLPACLPAQPLTCQATRLAGHPEPEEGLAGKRLSTFCVAITDSQVVFAAHWEGGERTEVGCACDVSKGVFRLYALVEAWRRGPCHLREVTTSMEICKAY